MSAIPNVPEPVVQIGDGEGHRKTWVYSNHIQHASVDVSERPVANSSNGVDTASRSLLTNAAERATTTEWHIRDVPVDHQRPIKVIIIGAGYSGVYLGIRIPERLRNCELTIYEKNAGVGGTWYENRYPGAACDVPSHSYQFSFNPKHDWSSLYAPSREIREYIKATARKYGADRFMKLEHEVVNCEWRDEEGKWHVKIRGPDGGVFEDVSDVLVSARGNLNARQWPAIDGLWDFKGEVMHSSSWNEDYDFTNKRIGVIGSGSSAIQIIPQLQKVPGAQLDCFIRSRTWISPPLGQSIQDKMGMGDNFTFDQEQIKRFEQDPEAWLQFRLLVEAEGNNIHAVTLKGTEMQKGARQHFEDGMRERLKRKPEYFQWLRPGFSPGCRRLTPGPGFLEALVEENVTFTRDRISRVEPTGVVTEDGKVHEIDVLVCATGFHASAAPPFQVIGLNGTTLQHQWSKRATNYLSLATHNCPNYFMMLGPNGAIGEGSLTMMIQSTGDYIVKAIRKVQKERIKRMVVKPERVADFLKYCDAYFKDTVFMDDCQSWYRKDGQGKSGDVVTGLWPGSCLHCIEALRSPRWEDYEYEYLEEDDGTEANPMGWLGNGWVQNQVVREVRQIDLGYYIMPEFQESPAHPRPEENERYRVQPWSY